MLKKIQKNQGAKLKQAVHNVLAVTMQQQQAFDNFLSKERERLHSFARYFAHSDSDDVENIQQWLNAFDKMDVFYSVIDLKTGRFCSNKTYEIFYNNQGFAYMVNHQGDRQYHFFGK